MSRLQRPPATIRLFACHHAVDMFVVWYHDRREEHEEILRMDSAQISCIFCILSTLRKNHSRLGKKVTPLDCRLVYCREEKGRAACFLPFVINGLQNVARTPSSLPKICRGQ